jgi:RNA polymerase sigma-70 factor (ECF subfamily)
VDNFLELMDRLRAGDADAARAVYAKWACRLIELARVRLGLSLAGKEDPEDVVQSAYRSFFRHYGAGRFHVEDWHDVWAVLATIAVRKCSRRVAYHLAARRDPRREEPRSFDELAASDPTPEQAAVLAETVERLLRGLDPPERAIVELSLQGYTVSEISERLGRAERSVQRVRENVRKQLERRQSEGA